MALHRSLCTFTAGLLATLLAASAIADDQPEHVTFTASDGYWLHADFYGPTSEYSAAPIALLLHERGATRRQLDPLIAPLRDTGWVILVPDLRGHGESATAETQEQLDRGAPELARDTQNDLHGAYDFLAKRQFVDRARFAIVAVGESAEIATRYAVDDRSVDALLLISPKFADSGKSPSPDFGQLQGRHFLFVDSTPGRAVCEQLAKRCADGDALIVDGDARGMELFADNKKLTRSAVDFLARSVGRPSAQLVYCSKRSNIYHKPDSGWIAEINPSNLRVLSSAKEAEARGLRAARSTAPRKRQATSADP